MAGAVVGSLALSDGDRWSDLDLTFAVDDNFSMYDVLEDWTRRIVSDQYQPATDGCLHADAQSIHTASAARRGHRVVALAGGRHLCLGNRLDARDGVRARCGTRRIFYCAYRHGCDAATGIRRQ